MTARSLFRRHGTAWLAATVLAAVAVATVAGPPASSQPGSAGTKANPDEKAAAASANKLVQQQSGDLKASDRDEFTRHKVITTNDGLQYVPYTRTYQDLPVVGGDFVVVTDAKGMVRSTSVQQQQEIEIGTSPKLTKAKAEAIARKKLDKVDQVKSTRLVVHAIGSTRLAYESVVFGTRKKRPSELRVFVDALTGKVLRTEEGVKDGTGTGKYNGPNPLTIDTTSSGGQYSMRDPNRPGLSCADDANGQVFTGSDDQWGNGSATDKETGCVDVMFGAQKEWNMLRDWLGRNGIDGNGNGFPVKVGLQANNAYWYPSLKEIRIGYNTAREWLTALDVIAHEFGHGLDQMTPGGTSATEVAEFTSDVFGAATEAYANESSPYDTPDYLVGEMVNFGGDGQPLRNMYDPSKVRNNPNCYSSSIPTMETHDAAGPGNHWFYLLAEGTNPGGGKPTSPTCNNTTLTGIGIQPATKIFYNAMLRKTSSMTYLKYRTATLAAAKDLDPTCTQFNKVKAAWDAVSVPAQTADPTCTGGGDTQAPTAPANLRSTGKTANSVSLAWDASTDNVGVTEYDVYNGSVKATTVSGTSATVSGLTGSTNYTFTVKARDAASNTSPASNAVSVTTDPGGGTGTAPDISLENVKAHLQQFQNFATQNGGNRRAGSAGYTASVSYIEQKLTAAGYTVRKQTCNSGCTYTSDNLIADWPGGDESQTYVLGAHLDSVAAGPGVNDNGSGSAALLETALTIAAQKPNMAKHIRFAWWTDEEQGTNGSEFYVNSLSSTDRSKIKGYLNFDMNGSPNAGYFVDNISSELAKSLTGYFDSINVPTEEMTECCSDDGSFRSISVPTTFLSTGASATKTSAQQQKWGGTAGVAFDKCYHQACDKYPDNINTTAMDRNADAVAYAVWKLAVEPGGSNQPPSKPANLRSTGKTQTSVSLAWDASTDDQGVTGYNVYNGSNLATTVTGTTATVSGLTAGTSYTFTVKAKDAAGLESAASDPVSVTTDSGGGGGGLTNGGFEAGALSSWTTGGTAKAASTVNSGAHGGTYAARLGSTTETNGESTLSQTFTVPSGSSELSFWYNITCPDTVTYAWAKATLTNTTTGATTTPLAKTCTNGQGWKQATTPVIAGNSYTLTLVNRDDNHPDDPVYTLFDDISAGTGTPGGNEFSMSVDPASLTVQKGQSTSTTVKTAVTSGSAQTVNLSASGLPSGASATFTPTSVNAGDSAKLTISTTSATPDGTSTVTITGDGTEVDRSTTLSLTVGGGDPNPGTLKQISKDIYTNTESQHATQVEPDAASWGNTIVSAQQTGRQYNGGATTLAWSTSTDGGVTWQDGNLSGITKHVGSGPHDRTTDPVVAYSAKHSTWLIGTTPMNNSGSNWVGQGMKVVRSADGLNWSAPIVAVPAVSGKNFDKSSFGCDNNSSSPRYGTCYAVIDDLSNSNALSIVTSTDGGQTWSTPVIPSGVTWPMPNGLITQPDGTVVIIYMRVQGGNDIMATVSKDGGKTWSNGSIVQHVKWHNKPGGELRGNPLPTMDVDAAGKIYLAWPDCQFRTDTCSDSSNNSRNDILLTTSTDGTTWTAPKRIPIAESDANMDRYIPEITVDHSTSGANAKIGLHYYFIEDGACTSNCALKVGYLSSANGGTSWSSPQTVAGPFGMHTLADTNQGRMIGEYTGAAFVNGKVVGAFPVGKAPTDGKAFDQGIYTFGPMAVTGGVNLASPAPAGASAKAADSQQTQRKVVG